MRHTKNYFKLPYDVDIDKSMAVLRKNIELSKSKRTILFQALKYFLRDTLFSNYVYTNVSKKDSKYLLFYGKWFFRADHKKNFLDFSSSFPDASIVYPIQRKIKFHPLKFMTACLYSIIWFFQLLIQSYSLFESLMKLPYIYACKESLDYISGLRLEKCKFAVVYYDISADDNFVVQYFKSLGIKTMTLQHGIFAQKEKKEHLTDFGLEFTESISDYYLAWNEYTRDEAIKAGMPESKIIVLGIPRYINFAEPSEACKSSSGTFGIILNNKDFMEHNKQLVQMGNEIAEMLNMQFVLRYHPQLNGNEFDNICNEWYKGKSDNSMTIKQYAESVEFTLISSSSVFVDLLLLKHPTYRLIITADDTYSSVPYCSFKTCQEFQNIYHSSIEMNQDLFNYICTSYNAYHNYRKFFDDILKGE